MNIENFINKANHNEYVQVEYAAFVKKFNPDIFNIPFGQKIDFDYQPHFDWYASCAWDKEGNSAIISLKDDVDEFDFDNLIITKLK